MASWGARYSSSPDNPPTYAFQTRRGDLGLLQAVRIAEEPRGMRIRYRLVAKAVEKPAGSAEKPAARMNIEISGHVVDEATGRTVPYFLVQGGAVDKEDPAKITWDSWGQESESANRTSRFDSRFDIGIDWSKGERARIVAGGYLSQPILTEPPKPGTTKIDGLVIAMKRGRHVSGHVFDYAGKPVKDAGVFVVGDS